MQVANLKLTGNHDGVLEKSNKTILAIPQTTKVSSYLDGKPIPNESRYKFHELGLGRSMIIAPYVFRDNRGEFLEVFNQMQFNHLLGIDFVQDCTSISHIHSLRGFHGDFQTWKLIFCPKGAVHACIIDLNPSSPTYFQSKEVLIDDTNRLMLLVPPGFGNSYYTLEKNTVYCYKKTTYFCPGAEFTLDYRCVKWPERFSLENKDDPPIMSQRDLNAPIDRLGFERAMKKRSDLVQNPFL